MGEGGEAYPTHTEGVLQGERLVGAREKPHWKKMAAKPHGGEKGSTYLGGESEQREHDTCRL